jgi:diguanylate cyclase (GGDEF)-like protein
MSAAKSIDTERRTGRIWIGYLIGCAVALVGYYLIGDESVRDVVYIPIALVGPIAIVVGVRIHRPDQVWPWYLMAAGQVLWIVADGLFNWYETVLKISPFPSLADAFYLAGYPVIAVGLLLLIRARRSKRDLAGTLDAATVTVGLGLLSWVMLAQPTIQSSESSFIAAVVSAAYPAADILLLAALVRLLTLPEGGSVALRLLLIALTLLIAGDTLFTAFGLYGAGQSNILDFLWLGSYWAWGAAALHPSVRSLSQPAGDSGLGFSKIRLLAMTLATLVAPGILAVQRAVELRLDVAAVVIGSVLMFLLVVSRMWLAIDQIADANVELERLQEELAFQAAHDSLTGLPNRAEATRMMLAALSRARRSGNLLALIFIDLDGFKAINDSLGHPAGDQVLRAVAERLRSELRGGDTPARLGGDEFVALLEPVDSEASAISVAERLIATLSMPIPLADGQKARLGASIGIAFNRHAGTDAEQLLSEADVAVYRAKRRGRGRVEVFDEGLALEVSERARLQQAIGEAITRDELVLFYQPIVRVETGNLDGYEALVRWQRPGHGLLAPDEFIPVAEQSDLICTLGCWVLGTAARQLELWNQERTSRDLIVSVNLSGRHINNPRVVEDVATVLEAHDIAPQQLIIEITETVLLDDWRAINHLNALRDLGVALSLDDFGTGYNSIAQLARLPVDFIKIDRSYLDTSSPESRKLFQLMVHVAHSFGLSVVGEGVEDREQLTFLEALQVEQAQGYFLGRAMPPDQLGRHQIPSTAERS